MKLTPKVALALLLVALVPLGVFGWVTLNFARDTLIRKIETELRLNSDRDRRQIEMLIAQFDERLRLVASRTQLRISLRQFLQTGDPAAQAKMNRILGDALNSVAIFEQICVTGLDGRVAASTHAERIGTDLSSKEFFASGKERVRVDHLSLLDGEVKIHLSGPLLLDDETIGVVIIRASTKDLMEILTAYVGLGETGETLLARRVPNGDAQFIGPLRFDANAALRRTVGEHELGIPTTQSMRKVRAMFTDMVDYRHEPVLALTDHLPATDWGLVSKIDRSEALAPIRRATVFLTSILLATGGLVLLLAIVTSRRLTHPILKLADAATHVSDKSDYQLAIATDASDEIGHLTRSFNHMLETIAEREHALQSSEERFRLAVRATEDGIWDWNITENKVYLSDHWMELLGHEAHELAQEFDTWRLRLHPADAERAQAELQHHLESREPYESEFRLRNKDGSYRWYRARGQAHWVLNKPVRMAGSMTDITERRAADETIRRSLAEKEAMLQEIHHRVKNNMQVICSLLKLQSGHIQDEASRELFRECEHRVRTMAMVHERLYQSGDLALVNFGEQARELAQMLRTSYGSGLGAVEIKVDAGSVSIGVDQAIPLGLILNELVSNAFKHAFPDGRNGTIEIRLRSTDGKRLEMSVEDDGAGLPTDFDIEATDSLGMRIVRILAQQADGRLQIVREGGTLISVSVPNQPNQTTQDL